MSVSMELWLWWLQGPWGRCNTAQDLPDCLGLNSAGGSGPVLFGMLAGQAGSAVSGTWISDLLKPLAGEHLVCQAALALVKRYHY